MYTVEYDTGVDGVKKFAILDHRELIPALQFIDEMGFMLLSVVYQCAVIGLKELKSEYDIAEG